VDVGELTTQGTGSGTKYVLPNVQVDVQESFRGNPQEPPQ
jgi:hypothetical protein